MEQQIEISKLKEWVGELYLEKKMLESLLRAQGEELSVLKSKQAEGFQDG